MLRLNKIKNGYMLIDGVLVIALISILLSIIIINLNFYNKNKSDFIKEYKLNDALKIVCLEIKHNYLVDELENLNKQEYYYIDFDSEKDLIDENFKDKEKHISKNLEDIEKDSFVVGFKIFNNDLNKQSDLNNEILDIEVFAKSGSLCSRENIRKFRCVV